MIPTVKPRLHRTTALIAPFVVCGLLGLCPHDAHAETEARPADAVRAEPGDVVFSVSPAGVWAFATRTGHSLVETGSVLVYTTDAEGNLIQQLNSASGTHSLLPPGGLRIVQEGAPGGARRPSLRADDDGDGKIDEDALDRGDNDHDGKIDEDFAAIGDAMAVVKYGPAKGGPVSVRQEVYAWSLPNIDHMAASTFFLSNSGRTVLAGLRVGIKVVPGEAIANDRMLARFRQTATGDVNTASIMLRGSDESLALLLVAPDAGDQKWDIRDDGETVFALSPVLEDLAPGDVVALHMALVATPSDETRATRAVQAARRTLLGDDDARMIPPPVSLTMRGDAGSAREMESRTGADTPAAGSFWLRAGNLDEALLVGSPNPFHDAITIDYEVPTRVVDDNGAEHALSGAPVPTSVKVYNVTGRLIATLVDSPHSPGRYRAGWTAHTDAGESVASGVYYVKLTIGRRSVTKRLVQLK